MLMSGQDYRESLRRYQPRVYVNGRQIESVADEPLLAPGVNSIALTYDFALREDLTRLMRASRADMAGGLAVNRLMAIPASSQDLLNKLEAVRLVCQETGCAQRYLGGDGLAAIDQATTRMDAEFGTSYGERFRAYCKRVYAEDLRRAKSCVTVNRAVAVRWDARRPRCRKWRRCPVRHPRWSSLPRIRFPNPEGSSLLAGD